MKRAHAERPHTVHVWRMHLSWTAQDLLPAAVSSRSVDFVRGSGLGGAARRDAISAMGTSSCSGQGYSSIVQTSRIRNGSRSREGQPKRLLGQMVARRC